MKKFLCIGKGLSYGVDYVGSGDTLDEAYEHLCGMADNAGDDTPAAASCVFMLASAPIEVTVTTTIKAVVITKERKK